MLRLKKVGRSINPAHIESVLTVQRDVIIRMVSDTGSITVSFKTENDAFCFREYVELLIDLSNDNESIISNQMVSNFETYFADYLISRQHRSEASSEVLKHLNAKRRAEIIK